MLTEQFIPKVIDFGYATTNHRNQFAMGDCTFVTNGGSALYKAPERLRGQVGAEFSDVYSFSLVLWSL